MPEYTFIDQPDSIEPDIASHARLGVDTEFMREKTYFAQLCLVQLATPDTIWCVDPLTDNSQTQFWETLLGKTWIVHSARQDIEVIYQAADRMPREIFDTQVAAAFLGMPAQVGYAGLVEELFGVTMAKSHTRADWTRRPLPTAVLDYAAEDVEYLLPAADLLMEKLEQKNRLDWAIEDSAALLDPALYEIPGDEAVKRLKGARNFRGARRAAAVRLAEWREQEAVHRNRPRQWILRDNVLLDIAYKLPASEKQLSTIQGMPPKLVGRAGKDLVGMVEAARSDSNSYQPPAPPDEAQKSLLKEMQAMVAACAQDLDIAAETLAPKRELSAVVLSGRADSRVFAGWRRELIGDRLSALL